MRLQGKTAYVTGGARGIGRGIVRALAAEGVDVMVADVLIHECEAVAEEVRAMGRRALTMQVDVTRAGEVSRMVAAVEADFGGLDIAVNNAGVVSVAPLDTLEEAEWDRVMDINAKGAFLCCKAALPALRRRGGGRIINVASIAGKEGMATLSHYCASKFAVVGLTNSLAKELAHDNITVNAICPGIVRTAMWDYLSDLWKEGQETPEQSWMRNVTHLIPQGRPQTAGDMGALAVFFATMDNVTGQSINIDGGFTHH